MAVFPGLMKPVLKTNKELFLTQHYAAHVTPAALVKFPTFTGPQDNCSLCEEVWGMIQDLKDPIEQQCDKVCNNFTEPEKSVCLYILQKAEDVFFSETPEQVCQLLT